MKKIILFLIYILIGYNIQVFSQKESNIWYFGQNAGITFSTIPPSALTNGKLNTVEGCASICDSNGNLLFYTDGETVWNKNHIVMDNGTYLNGYFSSTQSAIIVPRPGSNKIYFIFTVDAVENNCKNGLQYSEVDISMNGGLGKIITKNIELIKPTSEKVTVAKHKNNIDFWVISHGVGNNNFYCFLISSLGVNMSPIVSSVGSFQQNNASLVGYLKVSNNNRKLISAKCGNELELFDFDNSTGKVSSSLQIGINKLYYGTEFSSNNNKLYVSVSRYPKDFCGIYQYNLLSSDIPNSKKIIYNDSLNGNTLGALQIGIDKKIYFSKQNSYYLDVINNPDSDNCNFVKDAIYLGGKQCMSGLPNIVPSLIIKQKTLFASFIINDSNQCQKGNNFQFTNKSTSLSGTISYFWSFGDGDTSSQQNPQHSYLTPNTYTVKLVATTGLNNSDSITKMVVVLPSPTPSFLINDSTQCLAGNNFIFTNKSTISNGKITSLWQFADGNGSVNPNPTHIYSFADTFSVKLVATSDSGCNDSIIHSVIVGAAPNASFMAYDSSQCLERNNFLFSNKSVSTNGSFTSTWNFGDSVTSTLLNPMHKYNYADTFTVELIVADSMGCSDTFLKHTFVHVHPEPLADFSINDSSQCLLGNIFSLSNKSTIKSGTFTQFWDYADGYDTISYNSNHSYNIAGNYMIKLLIISDWACKDSILKKVYVQPEPKAGFSFNLNPQYKWGNKFIFTSKSVISSGNLHHYWVFGDGNTDTSINPTHSYLNIGIFLVKLIVKSDYGCVDTFYDSAFVLKFTKMNISFSFKNGCVGIPFNLSNTSTVDPPDSFINFIWDFGDGNQTIILEDPKHIYYSPGSYIITLVGLTAFGNKDTLIDTIEIYPSPTIDITALPDTIAIPGRPVTLTANGIYDQLLWFDSSTQQTVIVLTEGKYWVTATFNNGCKRSDTIEITKGENNKFNIVNTITPNGDGFNDKFVIINIDQIRPCKLTIFNRWGDELFSSNNYQNDWDGTYKGKTLPEGTYYYVLVPREGKIIKGAINILK
jgi:gliding motility-associated-like protein